MELKCPKDNEHRTFSASAHVVEEWVIDESGEFLESLKTTDVIHRPNIEDYILCSVCGTEAIKVK